MFQVGREENDERTMLLDRVTDLQLEIEELTKELQKYKDNDPEVYEKMNKEAEVSKHGKKDKFT